MCREEITERKPRERKPKTAQQALQSLMRLCARGEKSSGDALRLMSQWQVPQSERGAVLDKLRKVGKGITLNKLNSWGILFGISAGDR